MKLDFDTISGWMGGVLKSVFPESMQLHNQKICWWKRLM